MWWRIWCRYDVMENTRGIICGPAPKSLESREKEGQHSQTRAKLRQGGESCAPLVTGVQSRRAIVFGVSSFASPGTALTSSCSVPGKPTLKSPLGSPGLWLFAALSQWGDEEGGAWGPLTSPPCPPLADSGLRSFSQGRSDLLFLTAGRCCTSLQWGRQTVPLVNS